MSQKQQQLHSAKATLIRVGAYNRSLHLRTNAAIATLLRLARGDVSDPLDKGAWPLPSAAPHASAMRTPSPPSPPDPSCKPDPVAVPRGSSTQSLRDTATGHLQSEAPPPHHALVQPMDHLELSPDRQSAHQSDLHSVAAGVGPSHWSAMHALPARGADPRVADDDPAPTSSSAFCSMAAAWHDSELATAATRAPQRHAGPPCMLSIDSGSLPRHLLPGQYIHGTGPQSMPAAKAPHACGVPAVATGGSQAPLMMGPAMLASAALGLTVQGAVPLQVPLRSALTLLADPAPCPLAMHAPTPSFCSCSAGVCSVCDPVPPGDVANDGGKDAPQMPSPHDPEAEAADAAVRRLSAAMHAHRQGAAAAGESAPAPAQLVVLTPFALPGLRAPALAFSTAGVDDSCRCSMHAFVLATRLEFCFFTAAMDMHADADCPSGVPGPNHACATARHRVASHLRCRGSTHDPPPPRAPPPISLQPCPCDAPAAPRAPHTKHMPTSGHQATLALVLPGT